MISVGLQLAAVLNGASNGINQIYDLAVDAINKPQRPLPSGRMTIREAKWVTAVLYLVALAIEMIVLMIADLGLGIYTTAGLTVERPELLSINGVAIDANGNTVARLRLECGESRDMEEAVYRTVVARQWVLREMRRERKTLEDLFVEITARERRRGREGRA